MSCSQTRWKLKDLLRLELLADFYSMACVKGCRRHEDAENHRLLEEILQSDPESKDCRRRLLKCWCDLKWEAVSGETAYGSPLNKALQIPFLLSGGAFLLGILVNLSWGAFKDTIHAPSVLFTHALLPFLFFLAFLFFGNYFGTGQNLYLLFRNFGSRFLKGGREIDEAIRSKADSKAKPESGYSAAAPMVFAYTWLFAKVEGLMRKFSPESDLEFNDDQNYELKDVSIGPILTKRSGILRIWNYWSLQLMVVAYFLGFFSVYLTTLLFKSAAFHWGSTLQTVVSPERIHAVVSLLGTPWQWLAAPPSLEQISATQLSYGEDLLLAQSGWEAWAVFLMLAIGCYAILPRVLLCLVQWIRLRHQLASSTFQEQRFQKLLDGMRLPVGIQRDAPTFEELEGRGEAFKPSKPKWGRSDRGRLCLFITEELLWQENERVLEKTKNESLEQLQFGPTDSNPTLALDASALSSAQFQERIQAEINQFMPLESRDRIVFLLDAEQNPKNNLKTRVKVIRELAGDEVGVLFMLIHEEGEPIDEDSVRCRIWNYAVHRWNDPNIQVKDFKPVTKE